MLRLALVVCGATVLCCGGLHWWTSGPPPEVTGSLREPTWEGRSSVDVFSVLRRSYLSDVEPVLRAHCYSCHTDATFGKHVPAWIADIPLLRRLAADDQDRGLTALDLSWGFPFARDGKVSPGALAQALGDLETAVAAQSMPPPQFVVAHPASALSGDDRARILAWVAEAQARLGIHSRLGTSAGDRARNLLEDRCASCHGPSASVLPRDIASREELLAQGMILPRDVESSPLLAAVVSGKMPKGGKQLLPAEVDVLRQWIRDGDASAATSIGLALGQVEIRRAILTDLTTLAPGKRRLARYVVADPLRSVRESAFGRFEAQDALAAALLSASRASDPHLPQPLADGRVYRFLLSDYGWDAHTWGRVEAAYPMAFDPPSEGSRLAEQIRETTGATVDAIALDWLVYAVTQPPLYVDLVDLPETLDELEDRLGASRCHPAADPGKVQRAGFRISGVSRNNRVVERQVDGGYWLSYDFAGSDGLRDALARPLGPECTEMKPAFRQDGGEVIFSLPDGWQGYALVDGLGRRLDVDAPVTIVTDGTRSITNPRSCMRCHADGFLPLHDEVRDATAGGPLAARVQALYPEPSVLAAEVAQDSSQFREVRTASGVSPIRPVEAVNAVIERYLADVTTGDLSALLGVPDQAVLHATAGHSIPRKQLVAQFGSLVTATRAGTPRPPPSSVPFDDVDRRLAQPDAAVFEGDSGYRMIRVAVPDAEAVFVGEEVTQGLWKSILGEPPPMECVRDLLLANADLDLTPVADDLPVACATLGDAVRFANALSLHDQLSPAYVEAGVGIVAWENRRNGYRLPTIAEWRAAAGDTPFAGASAEDEGCAVGNILSRADAIALQPLVGPDKLAFPCIERPTFAGLAPVGSHAVAPSGLHDLTGNVAEILWSGAPEDRVGDADPIVVAGGSWLSGPAEANSGVLATLPATPSVEVGFRLVRDAPAPAGGPKPGRAAPGLAPPPVVIRPLSAPALELRSAPAPNQDGWDDD
jgi:hypothetical protein